MNMNSINQKTTWRTILWISLPVFFIANAYLLYLGELIGVLIHGSYAIYLSLLAWLTWRVTKPLPVIEVEQPVNRSRIWAQVGVLVLVILLIGLNSSNIPLWSGMVTWFYNLGESFLPVEWFGGPGNSIANPVQYFVIPFILLVLLGAKPAELGFGKGNKVWQTCLIWLALPTLIWGGLVITGYLPI